MSELLSETVPGSFAMVVISDPEGPVRQALRSGEIDLCDLGVLLLLIDHLLWQSARYWGDGAGLAEAMGGGDPEAIDAALGRLQRAGLIARGRCRRYPASRRYWCVLPAVATTGGRQRRRRQWLTYHRAWEEARAAGLPVSNRWEERYWASGVSSRRPRSHGT